MGLFPREHGAYGQLAFPLVTSFAVAGVTAPALLLALAAVAGFLAHEPLMVLIGRRGARAKQEQHRRAVVWLAITTAVAIGAGLAGFGSMSADTLWSLALPVLPGVFLVVAIAAQTEKGSLAEMAVALAFSLMAVPVCLAAGAAVGTAFAVAIAFALVFVAGTLAVRIVILNVRAGGNPRAVRSLRTAVLSLTGFAAVALSAAASFGLLRWTALAAAAPGIAVACWLAVFPPSPKRLRTVGWTLVGTSTAAALILIVGFALA